MFKTCQLKLNNKSCSNKRWKHHSWLCIKCYFWYIKIIGVEPNAKFIQYLKDHPDEALELE